MQPIHIPDATVDAYNAERVSVLPPEAFEVDGFGIEGYEGMKIGDAIYTVIGVDDAELAVLQKTKCFFLSFLSGVIPVFSLRVADFEDRPDDTGEGLPTLLEDFDLKQEARDSWDYLLTNIVFMQNMERRIFMPEHGEAVILEVGDFLIHNLQDGTISRIPREFSDLLIYVKSDLDDRKENQERTDAELQEPEPNSEATLSGV